MTDITDLITRLEAVQEPSRETDETIVKATGWVLIDRIECIWRSPDGDESQPPCYTSSVDAAMTLVPPGYRLKMDTDGYIDGIYQDGRAMADVHHPLSSGGGPRWKAFGATLPIAICIAALRAIVGRDG